MFKRSAPRAKPSAAVFLGLGALLTLSNLAASPAEARHRHHGHHASGHHFAGRHVRAHAASATAETPNFSAIVVDANTGHTLYGRNENELRHPASITKVMTLYLLFEQLEKGRMHLDTEIPVSAHAASQSPTKLGLRAGSTISVENAIKAVVTRSANDMAVAIAEAVGGDEDTFSRMMTRKAHALGMARTQYHNASGLPNAEQWTTARDLSILGRAIQDRFPRYYAFFSTHVFYFRGQAIANHNHLLDRVEGMDGIKTGYTNASGFNILTSVKRHGHFLVSVVMGGRSVASRDHVMAGLIDQYIEDAGTTRTASAIAENGGSDVDDDAPTTALARKPVRVADDEDDDTPAPVRKPVQVADEDRGIGKSISREPISAPILIAPVQVASIGNIVPVERPKPAFVPGTPRANAGDDALSTATVHPRHVSVDGSTSQAAGRGATATPSTMRWVVGAQPSRERPPEPQLIKMAKLETTKAETKSDARSEAKSEPAKLAETGRPNSVRGGWMIQIGATDDAAKASELLTRAKTQSHNLLGSAKPFTEKVQKGGGTLYRARFAGLEEDTAETACRSLKRSGFACFATKN
jgi:D-alanyl-D-alanine carboxypeptidase